MTTPEIPGDWHGEQWARTIAALPQAHRATLISAAVTLIDVANSDALESELTVFLDCACGTDLKPVYYDPGFRIDNEIRSFSRRAEELLAQMRDIRDLTVGLTAEHNQPCT